MPESRGPAARSIAAYLVRCVVESGLAIRLLKTGGLAVSGLPVFKDVVRAVSNQMRAMRQTQPNLMTAFSQLAVAGTKDGALDKKTRGAGCAGYRRFFPMRRLYWFPCPDAGEAWHDKRGTRRCVGYGSLYGWWSVDDVRHPCAESVRGIFFLTDRRSWLAAMHNCRHARHVGWIADSPLSAICSLRYTSLVGRGSSGRSRRTAAGDFFNGSEEVQHRV